VCFMNRAFRVTSAARAGVRLRPPARPMAKADPARAKVRLEKRIMVLPPLCDCLDGIRAQPAWFANAFRCRAARLLLADEVEQRTGDSVSVAESGASRRGSGRQ